MGTIFTCSVGLFNRVADCHILILICIILFFFRGIKNGDINCYARIVHQIGGKIVHSANVNGCVWRFKGIKAV